MTHPAVNFQIKQLEEHFNTRLFDRSLARIALTTAGALAVEYTERILALSAKLDTRIKEAGGQAAGSFGHEMRLYEADSMTHCATRKTVEVCFDAAARKAVALPQDIKAGLQAICLSS